MCRLSVTPTGSDASSHIRRVVDGAAGAARRHQRRRPPPASRSFPPSPAAFRDVRFDGSASTGGLGAVVTSYVWDFGDDTSGTGITATHRYTAPGTYWRELTVTDSNGGSNQSAPPDDHRGRRRRADCRLHRQPMRARWWVRPSSSTARRRLPERAIRLVRMTGISATARRDRARRCSKSYAAGRNLHRGSHRDRRSRPDGTGRELRDGRCGSRDRGVHDRRRTHRVGPTRFEAASSTPFIPTAEEGGLESPCAPCPSRYPRRLAMPGFESAVTAADLDGLVVTHLPNIFYLTNFLGTAGIAVAMRDRLYLILDFRYASAARDIWDTAYRLSRRGDRAGRADLRRNAGRAHQEAAATAARHRGEPRAVESRESACAMLGADSRSGLGCISAAGADNARDPISLVATDNVVERLRIVKDAHEIDMLRRGAQSAVAGGRRYSRRRRSPG